MKLYKTTLTLLLAFVLGMLLSSHVQARQYPATFIYNYDADTVTLSVDLGFHVMITKEKFRLYGINAPELRGPEKETGIIARDALAELIGGNEIYIETIGEDEKGKYGRYLCILFVKTKSATINVNQWLVDSGYAVKADY